jgi:hypothetical protein
MVVEVKRRSNRRSLRPSRQHVLECCFHDSVILTPLGSRITVLDKDVIKDLWMGAIANQSRHKLVRVLVFPVTR